MAISQTETSYIDGITAHRAMRMDPEEALRGEATVSMETIGEEEKDSIVAFVEQNLKTFLQYLQYLSPEDREMLLSYYLLSKTQAVLGKIENCTQTVCSSRLRIAIKKLSAYVLLGDPTEEKMASILKKAKLGHPFEKNKTPLSSVITLYAQCRSYQYVADQFKLYRPEVRRILRDSAETLLESTVREESALGAYIWGLVDKSSARGQGLTERQLERVAKCLYFKDDPVLGEFRVNLNVDNTDGLFSSKANN